MSCNKTQQQSKLFGQFTLYRVCCIEYIWLFVNAQCYVVLCISYSKWIFLAFKQFNSTKPIQIFKTYVGNSHDIVSYMLYWIHLVVCERSMLCCIVYFIFQMYFFFLAFKQFDSLTPTLLLENIWKHIQNLMAWNQCNF